MTRALLAAVAWLALALAAAAGARGLDARAEATAAACRSLAETWRAEGQVPARLELQGAPRPVLDLSGATWGGGDVGAALQAGFDRARTRDRPLLFLPPSAPGTRYFRSGTLTLATPGAQLCGYGARLAAADETSIALEIAADGVGVFGLTMEAPPSAFTAWPGTWRRSGGDAPPRKFPDEDSDDFGSASSHLVVRDARGTVLRDVTLLGGRRGGVRLYGATDALIEGACIFRPFSDGIHVVHGSRHVTVRGNRIVESGDDCISVVSYSRDEHPAVRDVLIENNQCLGSRTRGLTVIGGEEVAILDNEVRDTLMAGILVFPAPDHETHPVRDVSIRGNRLDGAGLRRDPCNNCGDIVVNEPVRGSVEDVRIAANEIVPRRRGAPVRPSPICEGHVR